MIDWLSAASITFGVLGLLFFLAGVSSAHRRRFVRFSLHTVLALACLATGALFLTLQLSLEGYRALTREDVVATIHSEPVGPSLFHVSVELVDGRRENYWLSGDEVYVDAHILKWKPWANLFGLHTAYELDRIAGRYHKIEDERTKPRSVYVLGGERMVDLFTLRRRYAWLEPVVDAEYGSAAFFPAREPVVIELLVSNTGLLFRQLTKPS